ncbi:MAG: High-affnity carbon uptake protein Hat/HatR [Cyclobacteriaceae bacterium]
MSEKDLEVIQGSQPSADISQFFNPFPGLRPFGIEEAHLFFGREGQSDEILMKLADNRFAAVLGASGSGKSSLMYCGLIPTLYGGFMTEAGSNWRVVVMRPGAGPIDNLAEALLSKDKNYNEAEEEDKLIKKTIVSTVLRTSSLGLIEAVKQLRSSENENFFILVDQFEELFRYKRLESATSNMDESSAFVNLLLEAVNQYDVPIYIAQTMRSDFIGECAVFPELTQMINDSHYLIPQMTRDQKRLCVEGPVAVGGGQISGRLIQQLLNDVGDNPDQLPILQHALMRTWAYWSDDHKDDEPMDLRHYNSIGTLREALSQHANEAYDSLSKREKQICEVMFKSLTEKGAENQGIRRPTKLGTIAAIAGVSEEEVIRVVEKFREPGRTLLMPPYGVELTSETVVDISHESLMRIWVRLKTWLEEEAKSAEMYLKLAEAAERYQLGRAGLWKMPDLQLALNWQEENKPTIVWGQRYNTAFERTMVFLETSKRAYETEQRNKEFLQKRAIKRSRIIALSAGFASLILLFVVVFAQIQANEATKQAAEAARQQALAEEQRLKAEELAVLAENEAARARSAAREAEEARAEAEDALKQAEVARAQAEEQRQAAVASAEEARKAQAAAEEQRLAAVAAQELADKNAEEANIARANADRLRFQSVAQSMAIKSGKLRDEEQRGVIAKQAYLFYEQYKLEGKDYNGDVYAGIYGALKALDAAEAAADTTTTNWNRYPGHDEAVRAAVFSKNGNTAYSAGSDGKIYQWNLEDPDRAYTELFDDQGVNRVMAISADERWLAAGLEDNDIVLINLQNVEEEPRYIAPHGGTVYSLAFMPDGSGIVSVGANGKIMKTGIGGNAVEIGTSAARLKAISISSDGSLVAGADEKGQVSIWDLQNDNAKRDIYLKDSKPIHALAFSNNNQYLAFGTQNGELTIYDLDNKEVFYENLGAHASRITDLEFSQDDKLLASSGFDQMAKIWVLEHKNDLPIELDDHTSWVWSVSFNDDGSQLITGADDGNLRVYPTLPHEMAAEMCEHLSRNMTQLEWNQFVGEDIEYPDDPAALTCPEYPSGKNAN